ncbi:hypothetical protein [Burkholderia humptydooensis]|nr:hypothetical protein [Burkholderia humptydooensis]
MPEIFAVRDGRSWAQPRRFGGAGARRTMRGTTDEAIIALAVT